jgi:hypothetical protein
MNLGQSRLRGSVLTITLALFPTAAEFHNPVDAQCPTPRTAITCEPTGLEYEKCAPPTREEKKAERFVLEQLRAGRVIKLSGTADKILRGCFIRDLLTAQLGLPRIAIAIDGATIEGPIDVRNEEIKDHVELTHCTFQGDVNLKRSHFDKGLSFNGSQFGSSFYGPGRLDTESATVDFNLVLDDCTFNNCFTFFKGMRVGVDWSLRRAKFAGSVDFTGINVGSNFFADRVSDNDPHTHFQRPVDFESAKVGLDGGLSNVTFDDSVNFGSAEFNNLSIVGSSFNGDVDFRGTKIDNFYLCPTQGVQFESQFKKCLTIEDMTFRYMSPEDWHILERFAEKSNDQSNQSTYSAQFYASLEAQFRKHGRPDQADDVYIAGMEKERKSLGWFRKGESYFLDVFFGYGRHLERLLLWWSPLFLFAGCIVFLRESNMETKKPEDAEHYAGKYKGIWYTIDLFLPIIRLGEADIWTPKQRWRIWWKYGHTIVGNLFVPIGLAAWTGIIK